MTDVLIVGAGPAGLTAALYAARAGVSVIVFDKNIYGGQIALTNEVDNYPGMPGVSGVDFATGLYNHASSFGAEVRFEEVGALELDGDVKRLTTREKVYEGRTVILAGGAHARKLGASGEDRFTGKGVSYCATCDAAFFKDKTVALTGSGNAALTDALFLANHCKKVYLIYRHDSFRASRAKQDAVRAQHNIEFMPGSRILEVKGESKVEGCRVETPNGETTLPVEGLFVALGFEPETQLLQGILPLTIEGYVDAGESCETPLHGVWVAGDLRNKPLRQVVTAAADGAVAGVAAAEYCTALDERLAPDAL